MKKQRPFEDEVQWLHKKYADKHAPSDLVVHSKGYLCELFYLDGDKEFVHVFNIIRNDAWSGITFGFNRRFVSKENGW